MARIALSVIVVAGLLAVGVCANYLRLDMAALNANWARFEKLAMSAADLRSLFLADARQNAFRINAFADGIGVLLGAILAAIGVHGLCQQRPRQQGSQKP